MARKRRPLRATSDKSPNPTTTNLWTTINASVAACPNKTPIKPLKGVKKARRKHVHDNSTLSRANKELTLADRFHALPAELRAEVFSHLIVRPVKWDVEHRSDCPLRHSDDDLTPAVCDWGCADGHHWANWRQRQNDGVKPRVSPWRSAWAPEQANPYLCTDCYHEKALREGPHPRPTALPCLCARRQNLEVFLVCKQWYEEAAVTFYTRNVFGFESGFSFVSFFTYMSPRWRRIVSHVSIMPLDFDIWPDEVITWARDPFGKYEDQLRVRLDSVSIWTRLRELPALTYLELDHCFLTRTRTVRRMQRLGLRAVKQVRFTHSSSPDEHPEWTKGTPMVWPAYAGRKLLVEGFAGQIARSIKGQRQKQLKNSTKLDEAILDFRTEIDEATRTVEWWEI